MGLEDLRRGKKGLVTVVVKEEQGAGLGFEGCHEFRERGAFPERERRGAVSKGPERGWGGETPSSVLSALKQMTARP